MPSHAAGFYNSFTKRLGWSKDECVRQANLFSSVVLRLATPPSIEARTVGEQPLMHAAFGLVCFEAEWHSGALGGI